MFALQVCSDPELYDPLDVGQWRFHVAADTTVQALGQKTARLSTIERVSDGGIAWGEVAAAVERASAADDRG